MHMIHNWLMADVEVAKSEGGGRMGGLSFASRGETAR
jgi:hypothetical protein